MRHRHTTPIARRVLHLLAVTAVATAGVVMATAGPGATIPPPTTPVALWGQVQTVANGTAEDQGWFHDLACPSDGTCVAVGAVEDAGFTRPGIAQSSGGVWGSATVVDLGGFSLASPVVASLDHVACVAVGECTAVGTYKNSSDQVRPFAVTSTGGVWGVPAPIDPNAFPHSPITDTDVFDVACSSAGTCTAVGGFEVGRWEAFTVSLSAGSWGPVHAVTYSGASNATGAGVAAAVECPADGACTVVGRYTSTSGREMFAASSTAGTWSDADRVAMPAGAATDPDVALWDETSLSCSAPKVCTAVGTYERAGSPDTPRSFSASSTGGAFLPAQAFTFAPGFTQGGSLVTAVTCPAGGACVAVGWIIRAACGPSSPSCVIAPGAAVSTAGAWSDLVQLPMTDEIRVGSVVMAGAFDVSCAWTTADCALVGTFASTVDSFEALTANRINSEWSLARRVAGPSNPGTPGVDVELFRVQCTSGIRCTAIGAESERGTALAVESWPMPTAPGAIHTSTTPGSRTVTVAWTPPTPPFYGPSAHPPVPGEPVPESYQVRCETGVGDPVFVGVAASPARVTLPGGATARCGVRARYGSAVPENSFLGDWFEGPLGWAAPVTVPTSAPDAPTGVAATAPRLPTGQATAVSFTVPTNQSGSAVTGVEAQCTSGDGGATRSATGTGSPLSVTGLTRGRTYRCAVRSVNGVGRSPWSWTGSIVVPAGPPTNVRASVPTLQRRATTVTFTRPDGGPTTSTFRTTCTSADGGQARTLVKTGTPHVVEGLTAGKTYRCTVTALYDGTPGETSAPSNPVTVPAR